MSEERNWKDEEILDIGSVGEDDFDPFGDDDFELEIQQHEEKKTEEKKAAEKKAADKKPPRKKDDGKESPSNPLEAEIKSEIKGSKEFLDTLKKAKDKTHACKLVPKITPQSKGRIPSCKVQERNPNTSSTALRRLRRKVLTGLWSMGQSSMVFQESFAAPVQGSSFLIAFIEAI